ncbi:hypothetical protein, partial [Candidatus Pantoea multigeneris]|uniref:hypothetical protein n=1 Tax=Candidatus Pantoea multigeneris TaxID=2608357 RepID=UPI0019663C52
THVLVDSEAAVLTLCVFMLVLLSGGYPCFGEFVAAKGKRRTAGGQLQGRFSVHFTLATDSRLGYNSPPRRTYRNMTTRTGT